MKKIAISSMFGLMFNPLLTAFQNLLKIDKSMRLNHYDTGTIQQRYAFRSTQSKRRKMAHRTGNYKRGY